MFGAEYDVRLAATGPPFLAPMAVQVQATRHSILYMHIGPISLRNPYALAPMAGYSDVPFRTVAWRMGAGYVVSEMVSAKPELWETGKSRARRIPVQGAQPVAIQIAGTNPQQLAEAARRHVDDGVQIIDINFGCPAKKVCRRAAGSALLADLELLGDIVATVASAVCVPVTVKTRTGLTRQDQLGLEAAVIAQEAGAHMVVLHGRSRACRFNGTAEMDSAQRLKQRLSIPLLVNGDIDSVMSARHAVKVTGADGVMIGRGAIGRPWIFAELAADAGFAVQIPSLAEKWQIACDHVQHTHEFYGEDTGLRIARKHVLAYLGHLLAGAPDRSEVLPHPQAKHASAAFMALTSARTQLAFLRELADRSMCETRRDNSALSGHHQPNFDVDSTKARMMI